MPNNSKYLMAGFVFLIAGCTSISSTLLNRSDDDTFYGNSNGEQGLHDTTKPFKGIPITVRVPTHVDIYVREKVRFLVGTDEIDYLVTPTRNLSLDTKLIYTNKVFTVDPKRPAAGSLNYTMDFGDGRPNDQYFEQIKSKITDQTIEDITTALATVTTAITTSTEENEGSKSNLPAGVLEKTRTVAWKRFDVDALDLEHQISEFVGVHMNNCHSCDSKLENCHVCPQVTEQ